MSTKAAILANIDLITSYIDTHLILKHKPLKDAHICHKMTKAVHHYQPSTFKA